MPTNETIIILQVLLVYFQTVSFVKIFWGSLPQDPPTAGRKQPIPQCLRSHNTENSGTGTGTLLQRLALLFPFSHFWAI